MNQCKFYASAIRIVYGIFAAIIAIALLIISSELNNRWYFIGGCLIYSLWLVLALVYAAHLDATAERIAQNERIIAFLSVNTQAASTSMPNVSAPAAEKSR